ncbi:hypothetical protein KKF61_07520 [Patescibacteria group bacterium]|nr:hypothetical protein [Patescibacteria group bacterium]
MEKSLRNLLIAEKVCQVDRTEAKYIDNPYGSQPTATIQAIAGTYSVSAFTLTDDTLTVTDEVIIAEHIYRHEEVLTAFNVFSSRIDEQNYAVAYQIDRFVVNNLCEDGTGTYTTPAGGFTTAANILTIMANLHSKVAGYESAYKKTFLIIENTDLPGFLISAAATGFQTADETLRNGFAGSLMGTDIYVIRTGTFAGATIGSTIVTNSGHRVFGVKGLATYATPRGIEYEELLVTAKTGREIRTVGFVGFKLWAVKAALIIDITLA